jgi:hypothetical protein
MPGDAEVLFLMLGNAFAGAQQAIQESGKDVAEFEVSIKGLLRR